MCRRSWGRTHRCGAGPCHALEPRGSRCHDSARTLPYTASALAPGRTEGPESTPLRGPRCASVPASGTRSPAPASLDVEAPGGPQMLLVLAEKAAVASTRAGCHPRCTFLKKNFIDRMNFAHHPGHTSVPAMEGWGSPGGPMRGHWDPSQTSPHTAGPPRGSHEPPFLSLSPLPPLIIITVSSALWVWQLFLHGWS